MQVDLLPHQDDFVTSEAAHPAICGGLGSGKSRAGTFRLIYLMASDPLSINTLYAMPTYDLLKLRAIPGIEEDLQYLGLDYKLNKSDYSIYIPSLDGYIYFRSFDNPNRFIAFEVAHSLLDELDTETYEKADVIWRKVNERTRQDCTGINTIAAVTTPDRGFTGFVYHKWGKSPQPGYEIIKASTRNNPFLPDGYVDQIMANYDPLLAEMYINGDFVSLSRDKVYHFFDRKRHHSDRVITDQDQVLHVGIDFNIGGCCANVFIIEHNDPIAVDEFSSHDTSDFINNLGDRYKGKKVIVYPDASGGNDSTNASASDIEMIENHGYSIDCPNKNPYIRDRVNSFNAALSHNRFKINTDKCPQLSFALESQGYDDKGAPEKFKTHPAIDDWVDNSGYFMNRKFPTNKPIAHISATFAR